MNAPPAFRDEAGAPLPGLTTTLAVAAAQQLATQGLSAPALEAVIAQVLRGAGPSSLAGAPAACAFVAACLTSAPAHADQAPLHEYLGAVLRLLALMDAVKATGLTALPPESARQ